AGTPGGGDRRPRNAEACPPRTPRPGTASRRRRCSTGSRPAWVLAGAFAKHGAPGSSRNRLGGDRRLVLRDVAAPAGTREDTTGPQGTDTAPAEAGHEGVA